MGRPTRADGRQGSSESAGRIRDRPCSRSRSAALSRLDVAGPPREGCGRWFVMRMARRARAPAMRIRWNAPRSGWPALCDGPLGRAPGAVRGAGAAGRHLAPGGSTLDLAGPVAIRDARLGPQGGPAWRPDADVYHGHDLPGLLGGSGSGEDPARPVVYDSHEIFLESGSTATARAGPGELPGGIGRAAGRATPRRS